MTGTALVGAVVSDAVTVVVGTAVVVVGATVVGGTVVGGTVVGGTVVGGTVVGGVVVGGTVVGVVSGVGVGVAVVALTVGVADVEVVGLLLVVVAAGVVAFVPGVDPPDDGRTGPTVVPVVVVDGLIRALMIGESPMTVPDCFVEPPIAFGLPLELPLALAWAADRDSHGSVAAAAGQLVQEMNPLDELPDWDALVP